MICNASGHRSVIFTMATACNFGMRDRIYNVEIQHYAFPQAMCQYNRTDNVQQKNKGFYLDP